MMPRKFIKTAAAVSGHRDYDVKYFPACISAKRCYRDLPHPFYLLHPLYTMLLWTVRDRDDISLGSGSAKSIIVAAARWELNKYQRRANI